jgi:hypothetical protein
MILPVLIAELKLRASFLLQCPFSRVEFREGLDAVLAAIVRAFVERDLFPDLPSKESMVAVGAEVF